MTAALASAPLVLASTRTTIAEYVSAVIWVYTVLIFIYVITQMLFGLGLRVPYSRASDIVLTFLRDVCEPFLRIFRRIVPSIGALDLSPLVAIIVLQLINAIVVQGLISG